MNAPPFPPNPVFNQQFGNWVWSGSRWVCTNTNGVRIVVQKFVSSAPYTPSPGLISCVVECWGGGGAGGQAGPSPDIAWAMGGGGGGSGGYSRIALASGLVLGGVNVTVGVGGTPGPAITNGTATSFGALCVANGGFSGVGNDATPNGAGQGAPGAPPGIGDIAMPGAGGGDGPLLWYSTAVEAQLVVGALGGSVSGGSVPSSPVGQGASITGSSAYSYTGAGGSGASLNQMAAGTGLVFGGAGGSGLCVVTEYCWADAIDDGCGCGPTGQARIAAPGWQGGYGYDND
jgi:hypothetical protein